MTYIPDLSECTYFRFDANLVAIGWLAPPIPYSIGRRDADLIERVYALSKNCWQPVGLLGHQICQWCWPGELFRDATRFRGTTVGANNLWIPGEDCIYVAPDMIVHYMARHWYKPPRVFRDAVARCPDMGSPRYLDRMLELGLPEFLVFPKDRPLK